jgi:2,4-dienoyl-CoA reductase-like NADH-dependent reductase (Old Yellow Enzyme family)
MDTNVTPAGGRPLLFTPLTIRGITIPNRTVLAPMVQYRALGGVPTDFHMVHLGKFALGRFGVVMTEATAVEPRGRVGHSCPGIWHEDQIPAWRRITDYIRREGSVSAMQLAHAGRKAATYRAIDGGKPYDAKSADAGLPAWPVVGPTTEPVGNGYQTPHQLSVEEIAGITRAFADGARRADAAGFDIVEIHGAHGYLLASFLSGVSNTRNDGYGGDRAGRMRFPLEVARAVRAVWPAHKPLFFRVSSEDGAGGWSLEDTVIFAQELKAAGVDVVDCSSGGLTGSAVATPIKRYPGFQVPYAAAVRQAGVASMAVGLILDGPQAEAILQEGSADLIAIGREALRNPFWPVHAAEALGCDPKFELWPEEYGWWLEKRLHSLARA